MFSYMCIYIYMLWRAAGEFVYVVNSPFFCHHYTMALQINPSSTSCTSPQHFRRAIPVHLILCVHMYGSLFYMSLEFRK